MRKTRFFKQSLKDRRELTLIGIYNAIKIIIMSKYSVFIMLTASNLKVLFLYIS